VSDATVEVVVEGGALLGEGPTWDGERGRLIWVDISNRLVHFFDPETKDDIGIDVGDDVGVAIPRRGGGLVLALGNGFALMTDDGNVEPLLTFPHGELAVRMNDGNCDSAGRFWAGTMGLKEEPGAGALYRLDPDSSVTKVLDSVTISNGIDWSLDDSLMYYVDSDTLRVDVFDFDLDAGAISNRRAFVTMSEADGLPDGLTVDSEGYVWVAFWGGSCVRRYAPDGSLDRVVALPTRHITSCAFGGPGLDELYITSATEGLSAADLAAEPDAGALFRCRPGVVGRPQRLFLG
jgi:sugar lactone lactonase YvrE